MAIRAEACNPRVNAYFQKGLGAIGCCEQGPEVRLSRNHLQCLTYRLSSQVLMLTGSVLLELH